MSDVGELLLPEILEVIPQKFVLIIAYHCLLLSQTTTFRVSEEHKEVRLFSISELSQIPIPEVYVRAVTRARRRFAFLMEIIRVPILGE